MKKYDSYKDSGIEWIGEIPSHWEIATVGRLCILGRGRVISAIEIAENEGVYPVYSSQTENYGIMGKINTYDFEGEYVTWTTDGANAGTVFYREGKFNCTNVCGTIQPKNWKQIDLKFLPYYLNLGTKFSVRLDINPKLMNNMMAKIPIAIPPKSEQTSIANFLDRKTAEIDELIADKKRLLELYEEEKTAIINQAVTKGLDPNVPMKDSGIEWLGEIPEHWEVKKLRYITKITTGAKDTENREEDGEYPFYVRSPNIERISTYSFDGEGILTAGDGVGVCKVWHYVNGKFDFHQRVYLIYDFKEIIGKLLFYYMKLNFIHDVLRLSAKSTVDSLRRNMFLDFQVVCPKNEEEQIAIVHHIESECSKIDFKKARTEELIELLTEYRTALISEAVTGKIKVTED
ncbi:MAG: restriction endonuclease subunit S [Fermentimonas sp.]|nr:restriction endonuclease subunit S [Fermentimonas sp.]